MSMNLTAKTSKGPIGLWQTPTWVTDACIVAGDNKTPCRGKNAVRSLEVYFCWVTGQLNGAWDSDKEYQAFRLTVVDHIQMVRQRMKEKGLEVGVI